ncbi:MAG TPA: hypothetical protein VLH79_05745 [Chthonomonadales bacterium]|nr:hypothetical protein [Chthonomonadales bacterium]
MGIFAGDGVARAAKSEAVRSVEREAEAQEFPQKERRGRNPARKRQQEESALGSVAVDLSELNRADRPDAHETEDAAERAADGSTRDAGAADRRLDIEA